MDSVYALLDATLGLSATRPDQLSIAQVCLRAISVFLIPFATHRQKTISRPSGNDASSLSSSARCQPRHIRDRAIGASLAGTLMLILTHWAISWFAARSSNQLLVKGHDTVLVREGVDTRALRAAHMSGDDLSEDLRANGIANPAQAKEARLERSGKLSVIRK